MNNVFFEFLDNFVLAYLNDILIFSKNYEEHVQHVNTVLARLRDAGLQLDIVKSEFCIQRTKYLGFILTTQGLEVDQDKLEVLHHWKLPTTITQL